MHHKMAFLRVGKEGILNCSMIDMQDCYPIYIYNLYTFGDLEKKPIICDKPKKPDIFKILQKVLCGRGSPVRPCGPVKVSEGQFLLSLQQNIISTLKNTTWTEPRVETLP